MPPLRRYIIPFLKVGKSKMFLLNTLSVKVYWFSGAPLKRSMIPFLKVEKSKMFLLDTLGVKVY